MKKESYWFQNQDSGGTTTPVAGVSAGKPLWERDNAFLTAVSAYFVAMLLFVALRVASGFGLFGLLEDAICKKSGCNHASCSSAMWTDTIATFLIQIVIFLFVPLLIVKVFSKQSMKQTLVDIGFNKPKGKVIGQSFLLGVLCYLLNIFVATASMVILVMIGYRFPSGDSSYVGITGLLIGIIAVGVLPGVCEEVSNRGVLMRGFMSKLGVWRAVLLSSMIFGLMHLNIVQMFYATILGIIMALAILATRTIWSGIIIHFMNNSLSQFLGFAQKEGWFIGEILDSFFDLFAGEFGLILFVGFAVLMYVLIINIIHGFAREGYKANEKEYFATFLKNNPAYVSQKISEGTPISMEDMSRSVDAYTADLSKMKAIRFYLEGQHKPQKLSAVEKTVVFGMVFLTVVITGMTLVWGLL